jgi:hypothetical protein
MGVVDDEDETDGEIDDVASADPTPDDHATPLDQ